MSCCPFLGVSFYTDLPTHLIMIDCPEGFYCPNGTGSDWKACPSGTYSNAKALAREQECTPCDGGRVCRGANLTAPNEDCAPGYYCVSGAATTNPYMTNLTHCPAYFKHITIGGICPRGHYCTAKSSFYKGILLTIKSTFVVVVL